jgi:hypothetical protein
MLSLKIDTRQAVLCPWERKENRFYECNRETVQRFFRDFSKAFFSLSYDVECAICILVVHL